MEGIITGIFLMLHGLVHLLYFGHSMRFFELSSRMNWPDGARLFSPVFSNETIRNIAANGCVLAAIGFVTGATGLFTHNDWWQIITVISAGISSVLFLSCWDWKCTALANKGIFAILINSAVLLAVLVFNWPAIA
ncbi:MAG: hypothetical protein JW712_02550 [Dehalococcoidales bacterium]|nr:hypothetical protein [Dehalococcoidales bacterium]